MAMGHAAGTAALLLKIALWAFAGSGVSGARIATEREVTLTTDGERAGESSRPDFGLNATNWEVAVLTKWENDESFVDRTLWARIFKTATEPIRVVELAAGQKCKWSRDLADLSQEKVQVLCTDYLMPFSDGLPSNLHVAPLNTVSLADIIGKGGVESAIGTWLSPNSADVVFMNNGHCHCGRCGINSEGRTCGGLPIPNWQSGDSRDSTERKDQLTGFLEAIASLLRPGGVCIFATREPVPRPLLELAEAVLGKAGRVAMLDHTPDAPKRGETRCDGRAVTLFFEKGTASSSQQ